MTNGLSAVLIPVNNSYETKKCQSWNRTTLPLSDEYRPESGYYNYDMIIVIYQINYQKIIFPRLTTTSDRTQNPSRMACSQWEAIRFGTIWSIICNTCPDTSRRRSEQRVRRILTLGLEGKENVNEIVCFHVCVCLVLDIWKIMQ